MCTLQLACWNVLADCYCSPPSFSSQFSKWDKRFSQISAVLSSAAKDAHVFLLQEIDNFEDFYAPLFDKLGFDCHYIQRPGKNDGCLLAYARKCIEVISIENVFFDDLAFSQHKDNISALGYRHSSFMRHNVAVIAHLRIYSTEYEQNEYKDFVIATPHLYWNPNFSEVKDGQVTYLLDRIANYCKTLDASQPPLLVIGGDFNSLPDSKVYSILANPFAPCNPNHSLENGRYTKYKGMFGNIAEPIAFLCDSSLSKFCRWLRVLGVSCSMYKAPPEKATQHPSLDPESLFQQVREQKRVLLTTAKKLQERGNCPECFLVNDQDLEGSLIGLFRVYDVALDVSKFLTVCGKCGGSIVSCHGGEYREYCSRKMDRVENDVGSVRDEDEQFNIIRDQTCSASGCAGKDVWVPEDRQIFICVECLQPYWWSESEESSPARAMKLAYRLYILIKRSLMSEDEGAVVEDEELFDLSSNEKNLTRKDLRKLFNLRDASLQSFSNLKETQLMSEALSSSMHSVDISEMKQREVEMESDRSMSMQVPRDPSDVSSCKSSTTADCSLELSSVFIRKHNSEAPYTNWTESFKGTLDYVFTTAQSNVQHASLVYSVSSLANGVASYHEDFAYENMPEGPFPNESWPSDHLMLVAQLKL